MLKVLFGIGATAASLTLVITWYSNKKSRDKSTSAPQVTFDDVIGLEEAKAILKDAVHEFIRKGFKQVVFQGALGTGKRMTAKALAHAAASAFVELNWLWLLFDPDPGQTIAATVDSVHRPTVIFIDNFFIGDGNNNSKPGSFSMLRRELDRLSDVFVVFSTLPNSEPPPQLRNCSPPIEISFPPPNQLEQSLIFESKLRELGFGGQPDIADLAAILSETTSCNRLNGGDIARICEGAADYVKEHDAREISFDDVIDTMEGWPSFCNAFCPTFSYTQFSC